MTTLERVEAWAKARGYLRRRLEDADEETLEHLSWARYGNVETDFNPTRVGWHVATYPEIAEKGTVLVWLRAEDGRVGEWTLTPRVAWLWAHAVDTGREVRRRCPDCDGHGRQAKRTADAAWEPMEPSMNNPLYRDAWQCRHCPTCGDGESEAPGYLDTPLARVVCEGAPRLANALDHAAIREGRFVEPGDPTARTELLAAAYGLNPGLTDEERAAPDVWRWAYTPGVRDDLDAKGWLVGNWTWVGGVKIYPMVDPRPIEPGLAAARLRDHLEEHGVRVTPERTLALTPELAASSFRKPHGVLGQALALWLSGAPCRCGGVDVPVMRYSTGLTTGGCKSCHGHGTALAAYVAQQLELEQAGALEAAE